MESEASGQVCHPTIGKEWLIPGGAVHPAKNIRETAAR